MPISGLVIVLNVDDDAAPEAVESIRANPCFSVAATRPAGRVPAVLETATDSESRAQIEWARSVPGVAMVEVAAVFFTDTQPRERNGHGS